MPRGSSPRRERQYEHILDAERDRGVPKKRAQEIAARTVNKARARTGEAKTAFAFVEDRHLVTEARRLSPHARRLGSHP